MEHQIHNIEIKMEIQRIYQRDIKVHPAFQKMTAEEEAAGNNPLGKWDDELQ